MRTKVGAAIAATVAISCLAAPAWVQANTIVFGQGYPHECSMRAIHGASDNETLKICTDALDAFQLSDSDYAKTLVNLGVVDMRRSSYKDAAKMFDKAEQTVPNIPEIYVNRGVVLMKEKMFQESIQQINRGIELGADEMEKAYYDRAVAKEAVGDVKGAYLDYMKASELKPDWDPPKKELLRFEVQRAPA